MSDKPLDELYFTWLYSQVGDLELANPSRTYWNLLRKLYTKEFFWIIPKDDNRAADGRQLRFDFIRENEDLEVVDEDWLDMGCSFLELLIAMSQRLAFEGEGEPRDWFWELIENLGLELYTDDTLIPDEKVEKILNDVIYRTYEYDGSGGLFPIKEPDKDQREVELWYQMSAYLLERM